MSIQKNIILQIDHSNEKMPPDFVATTPTEGYDINIQVANGWAITGHYHNQILQTITLKKISTEA